MSGWRILVLGCGLLFGVWGCVSGSIRSVTVTNEFPKDLSQEIRDKFEVREASREARAPSSASASAATSESPDDASSTGLGESDPKKQGKQKATGKKKSKKRRNHKGSDSESKDMQPQEMQKEIFKYPSRRPAKDPIWVGEHLVYSISYFGVSAGELTLDVLPFKELNHRKVYHVRANAISSVMFSLFYRLNDIVETFIDYEGTFSHRFHLILDESKQKRDALELNDSEKKQTFYWNRWHHNVKEFTESKEFGHIESFSQDSLSALYYIRTLPLPNGAVIAFPVVSEGKPWEAICTVVRREVVSSPFGKVSSIVIKPETKYQGVLKKNGDSFLWVTDDDRRLPLKLEAKVKIGTVVAELKRAELGTNPALAEPLTGPNLGSAPGGVPAPAVSGKPSGP